MNETVKIWQYGGLEIGFGAEGGGFPTRVGFVDDHANTVISTDKGYISCQLGDGRVVYPYLPKDFCVYESDSGDAHYIEYRKIPWRDEAGDIIPDFYLSLTYELWPDGSTFVNSYFLVENTLGPDIRDFILEIPLTLEQYNAVNMGMAQRPEKLDVSMIQSAAPERFVPSGSNRNLEKHIVPYVSFDCSRQNGKAAHLEYFVEGQNALSGSPAETRSEIIWRESGPVVRWNFQTEWSSCHGRPRQWRNQWGWLITTPPAKRHHPPLRMYHYIDNHIHYPSDRQIAKMAAANADVLVLHESWRIDVQDGGIPYDSHEFERVVDRAHHHGIRIAVYIRGNEASATEGACQWFDSLLQKNYDGLYIDFGGPFHEVSLPDESYQTGRMHFRRHYIKLRKLRERVGPEGLLLSHTGPLFSGLGFSGDIIDSYVSGEGERGIMLRDRLCHEYFSAAYTSCGSLWTAAFPEYGTSRMVPFMASTGQFPHSPLGVQFASSSLSHPRDPGINDVYLRPLWKLWGVFANQRDVEIYNRYNSVDVVSVDCDETGFYLMVSKDRSSALLIIANYSDNMRRCAASIQPHMAGLVMSESMAGWDLTPTLESPGEANKVNVNDVFTADLDAYGIAGRLLTNDPEEWRAVLSVYAEPYPCVDEAGELYLCDITEQKILRNEPTASSALYIQVIIHNLPIPYEETLWWDLYENALNLVVFDLEGEIKSLGWISKDGLVAEIPPVDKYIWPGHESPWVNLHDILPSGKHRLGIRSWHLGEPFYSFVSVVISPGADREMLGAYTLDFKNEIEPDRSCITFSVELKGAGS